MTTDDTRLTARRTGTVIGLVLLTALLLFVVLQTRQVLVWILIAAFFAVALDPAVNWVERRATWCRRWLATLLIFVLVVVALAALVTVFVIPLARESGQLIDQYPQLVADVKAGRGPVGQLAQRLHVLDYAQSHSGQLRGYVSNLGGPTLAFVRSAATGLAGIITIFVLSFLMVLESPRIIDGSLGLFEAATAQRIRRVGADCARTVTGYITGNLLISVICGLLTYLVLKVTGVPFAGLIALFVGIADLIPLVGATLGAVVAVVAGLTVSLTVGIIVLVFFIAYQQLENHLLQPVIFSRTVKLNALTVLIAILIAVKLAGILGALLAIPVAGMLQIVTQDVWRGRNRRFGDRSASDGPVLHDRPGPGDQPAPDDRRELSSDQAGRRPAEAAGESAGPASDDDRR